MTHRQILLVELAQHGRVTYGELMERYGDHGYTKVGFVSAARRLRARGLIVGPGVQGGDIVKADVCPCCGRELETA
jgi:hypothetical protein